MIFIDQTEIYVGAGKGGDGVVTFRTARNMPKLGPDGGYGGHGGSVYFITNKSINTLSSLRYKQKHTAGDGGKGEANNRTGACGKDLEITVPVGTVVKKADTLEIIAELVTDGERRLIAKGGRRGRGNLSFVTPTNRAPKTATKGQAGEQFHLSLELKVLSDIGFAGMPNAGKSTILSKISNAKPKIADYPFTTLSPVLGIVNVPERDSNFTVADIPGLIRGASLGKGLGFEFLRHLERTKLISYVIDASLPIESTVENFKVLQNELIRFNKLFKQKEALIILNKMDLLDSEKKNQLKERFKSENLPFTFISAATGEGINDLINRFSDYIKT